MTQDMLDPFLPARTKIQGLRRAGPVGRIAALSGSSFAITGLSAHVGLGDEVSVADARGRTGRAEVTRIAAERLYAVPFGAPDGMTLGAAVRPEGPPALEPHDAWVGRVVDPFGEPLDGRPLPRGPGRRVRAAPPPAAARRGMGDRLATGIAVLDTMLPLAAGQRMGLFAGSGVGKSTLLGQLARSVDCDVCVVALIGERGRELGQIVRDVLGPGGMARSVVVSASADQPAATRRRAAFAAMTVAEHFRDAGRHVAFLCDSVTRLAEAHREMAASTGEACDARGHPASLVPLLAGLSERAGPGAGDQGDITAVMSVLVAGSDLDEPVADILRGQLDGHVILSRRIARAGRYPAVDVVRSISRCLPAAASDDENALISEARGLLATMDRASTMVEAGLYERGASPEVDRAISTVPKLEALFAPDRVNRRRGLL